MIALIAVLAILLGGMKLVEARRGLSIERVEIAGTPATIFKPAAGTPGPPIVIAHGFAGSQQLMQPLAITLAQSGYTAITYDLLGHGRNQQPMTGSLSDLEGATGALVAQLSSIARFATPGIANGTIGVLGHSMASDIVVRLADTAPAVKATVALSMFSTAITPQRPPNLLVIVGALEPFVLKAEAMRAVAMQAAGSVPETGRTYGDFEMGTARRASFSEGVEHIGVLYSAQTLRAARDWFNLAFGRSETGSIDARGLWLALLFGGLVLLAYPLSRLLPLVSAEPAGAGLRLRVLLPLGLVATLATPPLLWKLPTAFLPILLGDYLALHFLTFGFIMLAGWRLTKGPSPVRAMPARRGPALVAALLATGYCLGVFGWALDSFVISFAPTPARLPLVLFVFVCLLPFFLVEAWLTSAGRHAVAASLLIKLCFLVSLGIAVALNLQKLFFLIIIIPVMLIVLAVFGAFSHWIRQRTGHPAIGATMSAAAIAYAIGVTFPMVMR